MTDPHANAQVRVTHEFATSADALWKILGDFADLSWVPAVPRCEFEGTGVGMIRYMYLDETYAIAERLDAHDDERRTITYSIPENNPLPIADYRATMTVHERGPQRCELEWSCTWSAPIGMTEEQAVAHVTKFYWDLMPGIERAAGVSPEA
jgi:hypothetical protein